MISVITPSVRPETLPIVEKCLKRQDFTDWEWIVTSPVEVDTVKPTLLLKDPPKERGDFWSLCKGWNQAYAHAKGELIVNIQDGIWFPPDTLIKLWYRYLKQPRILVSAVGDHYDHLDEIGVPEGLVWSDPRKNSKISFEDSPPSEIEMTLCSVPKQALVECGGIDEIYDTCCGVQEKEMCWRLNKMNWDFYVDRTIEYKALHHPRLTEDWDEVYKKKTTPIFVEHMRQLTEGTRLLNVNNLSKYAKID